MKLTEYVIHSNEELCTFDLLSLQFIRLQGIAADPFNHPPWIDTSSYIEIDLQMTSDTYKYI